MVEKKKAPAKKAAVKKQPEGEPDEVVEEAAPELAAAEDAFQESYRVVVKNGREILVPR